MDHPSAITPGTLAPAPAQPVRLYSLKAIAVGTLLGSGLTGAFLISRNLKILGNRKLGRKVLIIGFVGIVALLFVNFLINVPNEYVRAEAAAFEIGQIAIVQFAATRLIGGAITRHRANGGAFFSSWRAAGVGLLWIPAVIGIAIVIAIAFPNLPAIAE